MSFIRRHLKERHVDLDRTRLVIDDKTDQATFLCFNLLGQLIGFQKYNPHGEKAHHNKRETSKYFTCVSERHRYAQAWGLDTLHYRSDVLYVTEGVFDAVRLHNLNLPAIATFTNSPPDALRDYLRLLPHKIVGILDNDSNASGSKLEGFCDEFYYTPDPYKDLGEMPESALLRFINKIYKCVYKVEEG